MSSAPQNKSCDRASCDFRVDPDDPYRHVCLPCGLERSIKKAAPPKKSKIDPAIVWTLVIMAGWFSLLALDVNQPLKPTFPQPTKVE